MNRLPRGITGFSHVSRPFTLPRVDEKELLRACYAVARDVAGKVIGFQSCTAKVEPSYRKDARGLSALADR